MSDENTSDEGEGIKNLRKEFESLKRQNAELHEALGGYQKRDRQAAVANILTTKGVDAKAASLYEGEDVTEDAVGKWLDEQRQRAALFGVATPPATQPQQQTPTDAAVAAVAQAMSGNQSPIGEPPAPGAVFGNAAEIEHAIKTLPYEELVKLGYMPADDPRALNRRVR